MADDQKPQKNEQVVAYGTSGSQTFPLKPKTWDYVKEAFQPTDVRAQIDAIRQRRRTDTD